MTPVLAREIATQIVNEALLDNWKFYLILIALLLAGNAIFAFASSFFQKRGETAANARDFQELIRQLRETTTAAEEVRAAISHTDWATREWRALRRTKLEELVSAAYELKEWISLEQNYRVFDGNPPGPSPLSKLETISRLYFPELFVEVRGLVLALHENTRWTAQIQHAILGVHGNLDARLEIIRQQYLGQLEERHAAIVAAVAAIEDSAPALMRDIAGA